MEEQTFIQNLIKESQDVILVSELKNTDEESLKVTNPSKDSEDDYVLGCAYKAGTFLTDPNHKTIYRNQMPNYYRFLKEWYHLD